MFASVMSSACWLTFIKLHHFSKFPKICTLSIFSKFDILNVLVFSLSKRCKEISREMQINTTTGCYLILFRIVTIKRQKIVQVLAKMRRKMYTVEI